MWVDSLKTHGMFCLSHVELQQGAYIVWMDGSTRTNDNDITNVQYVHSVLSGWVASPVQPNMVIV